VGLRFLSEAEERPARVVQVPKTLKAPRTISVEPSYMMLRQQSIAKPLMYLLESGYLGFKSIRFADQSVNRDLARTGSVDGSLSTIDLSDASDLVSLDVVRLIFQTCPSFLQLLLDSRTSRAELPDASQISLKKFASMGSALCFPIEAMVFFTITLASLVHQSGRRPSKKLLGQLAAKIAVYGDDIIVPTETADGVMEWLEAFGLRVNHNKSFTKGFFRESCGGDYYMGEDITPSYVRQWTDTIDTRNPRFVAACVSLSNQFYMKGLWHASQYLRDVVEAKTGAISSTSSPIGCLTWASLFNNNGLRYNTSTSGYSIRGHQLQPKRRQDPVLDIRGGLLVAFGPQAATRGRLQFASIVNEHFARQRQLRSEIYGMGGISQPDHIDVLEPLCVDQPLERHRSDSPLNIGGILDASGKPALYLDTSPQYWDGKSSRYRAQPGSWEEWLESCKSCMAWATPILPRDLSTSVRPYALKMKRRLVPVFHTGLDW